MDRENPDREGESRAPRRDAPGRDPDTSVSFNDDCDTWRSASQHFF